MIKAINVSYRYSKGEEVLRNINLKSVVKIKDKSKDQIKAKKAKVK